MRVNYKRKILQGARELFYLHGIKKITMDDIAKHLSISKKTIYKEFADKNEILESICRIDFDKHKKEIDERQVYSENAIDAIVQIMQYVHEYLDGINPDYFYDMKKYHADAWAAYLNFKNKYVLTSVTENLERGEQEDLYRNDLNKDIISKLRIAEMDVALNTDLYPLGEYNLVDIHDELLRHYLQGITTLKGHKLINKYFNIYEVDHTETDKVFAIKK